MPRCKVEKEFERLKAVNIVQKIKDADYSLIVCEWALRAFVSLTASAMHNQNTDAMADFLDGGGCEILIEIMDKYSAANESIASFGCLTVAILSWSLRDMKEFLGEIGACEVVVFATSMHIGHHLVSEYGSGAIALLAKENISNSWRLAEAGACDVISQVANYGFCMRQENCVEVASNVCFAFAQLSEAKNAGQLLECGAPSLVAELLKMHLNKISFLHPAIKSLCALASLNPKHREELGKVGACELVVKAVECAGSEVSIVQEACEAIMHVS